MPGQPWQGKYLLAADRHRQRPFFSPVDLTGEKQSACGAGWVLPWGRAKAYSRFLWFNKVIDGPYKLLYIHPMSDSKRVAGAAPLMISAPSPSRHTTAKKMSLLVAMLHRHLNHQRFTLAAIDDVISRGRWRDWADLRHAALRDRSLLEKVERICRPYAGNPYAQRYHFWMHYVEEHRAAS